MAGKGKGGRGKAADGQVSKVISKSTKAGL